jgi:acid phosphatase family membrane protein YuiD
VQTLFTGHPITDEELKELVGHTTIQVVVGGVIGVVYSLVYLYFRDWF